MLDPLIGAIGFGPLALVALATAIAFFIWRRPVAAWLDARLPQPTMLGKGQVRVASIIVLELIVAGIAIAGFIFHLVRLGAENA